MQTGWMSAARSGCRDQVKSKWVGGLGCDDAEGPRVGGERKMVGRKCEYGQTLK